MYLKHIHLENYGPIAALDVPCPFDDDTPLPFVFVGENGSGKSILLSHIVNALLIAQQRAYPQTPEIAENRVYKLRSSSYIKSGAPFSYSRIEFEDRACIEELQLAKKKKDYNAPPAELTDERSLTLWNAMPATQSNELSLHRFSEEQSRGFFDNNCILYFPPNRFEDPAWLNIENLNARATHVNRTHVRGHTERSVINYSPLRANGNWLYDVIYDSRVFELQTVHPSIPNTKHGARGEFSSIGTIPRYAGPSTEISEFVVQILRALFPGRNVRFSIGRRQNRTLGIIEDENSCVPNVFQLSSGEISLLNIFISILRDFDLRDLPLATPQDIRGIVVVDEVDLHLHTVHQYDILPSLLRLFPRVQFVLTTHSPLFALGLRNVFGEHGFALYNLKQGALVAPEEFDEFEHAYKAFRNTRAYLREIEEAAQQANRPLLFVDGETDVKYLRRAMELRSKGQLLEGFDIRGAGGDGRLTLAWKALKSVPLVDQTVVLLHDCDSKVSNEDSGNVCRRKTPYMDGHPVRRGIENLFPIQTLKQARRHKPAFVDITEGHNIAVRGERRYEPENWKICGDEKSNLCDWLCANGTKDDFRYFDAVFDDVGQIWGRSTR